MLLESRRIRDTEQFVEAKMRFQISRPGKHSLTVHALCDSYVGIDKKALLVRVVFELLESSVRWI